MAKDPIVEEIRCIREEQAAKYAFDIKVILSEAMKRQRRSRLKVVSFVIKKERLTDSILRTSDKRVESIA